MEEVEEIVQLSEMLLDEILSGLLEPVIMFMLPAFLLFVTIRFVTGCMRPFSEIATIDAASSILIEPLHREKLTRKDVETIEAALSTLEPEPTHREEYAAAPEPEPKPVHIKMVKCKHCLAPKPEGGTCAYCGLG